MARTGTNWLRYGCFGCGGLAILVVLVLAGIGLVGLAQVRGEEVATTVVTSEESRQDRAISPEQTPPASELPARVVLQLSHGEFEIEPGPAGQPLRVEGRFDQKSYELTTHFETAADGTMTQEVRFRRTGSMLTAMLKQLLGGHGPKVLVQLPPDIPTDFDLEMEQGGAQIDLGGLWLTSGDLRFNMSGFMLEVSEPTHQPIRRLAIESSMAGGQLDRLGNASPKVLELDVNMGGFQLDLRGAWRTDSDISIDARRAGVVLELPDGVRVNGLEGAPPVRSPADSEVPLPTLNFSVTQDSGSEVEIR